MKIYNIRFITALSVVAGILASAANLAAQPASNCQAVSGTISTNFVDQATTVGTATGDIAGGVSAVVQAVVPGANGGITFTVVHRFVNSAGDHIISKPADRTCLRRSRPQVKMSQNVSAGEKTITGGPA